MNEYRSVPDTRAQRKASGFSPLDVEQYRLGELDKTTERRINALLEENSTVRAQFQEELNQLDAEDRHFLETHPRLQILAGKEPVYKAPLKLVLIRGLSAATGMAALVALGFGLFTGSSEPAQDADLDLTRMKGSSATVASAQGTDVQTREFGLSVFRNKGDKAETLKPGSRVSENDNLQIAYRNPGFKYGMIFSLDGNRRITLHYPPKPDDAATLAGPGLVLLPYAYCLDNAPGYENFHFLASNEPIKIQAVLDAVQKVVDLGPAQVFPTGINDVLSQAGTFDFASFPLTK